MIGILALKDSLRVIKIAVFIDTVGRKHLSAVPCIVSVRCVRMFLWIESKVEFYRKKEGKTCKNYNSICQQNMMFGAMRTCHAGMWTCDEYALCYIFPFIFFNTQENDQLILASLGVRRFGSGMHLKRLSGQAINKWCSKRKVCMYWCIPHAHAQINETNGHIFQIWQIARAHIEKKNSFLSHLTTEGFFVQ